MIPEDWQGVSKAPLQWLRRKLPRRFQGPVLLLLVAVIALPIVWQFWRLFGRDLLAPQRPVFLVRPHHDFPYGYAFFRSATGELVKVRSYPIYNIDMHKSILPQALDPEPGTIRDAYRIALSNPGRRKYLITRVDLVVRRYERLPSRYVCVWSRKGIEEALTADIELRPGLQTAPLLPETKVIELAPEEAEVLVARIRDAQPGLYTIRFQAEAQPMRGRVVHLESGDFRLFVPNRKPDDRRQPLGVSLLFLGDPSALIDRILRLGPNNFKALRRKTNPISLDADLALGKEVSKILGENDRRLTERLLKVEGSRPGAATSADEPEPEGVSGRVLEECLAGRLYAPDCAELLIKRGRAEHAGRLLRNHLLYAPDDAEAYPILMRILLEKNQHVAAEELWESARRAGLEGSEAYYHAGFEFARATKKAELELSLVKSAGLHRPDSANLLVERVQSLRRTGRNRAALDTLAGFCRHFEKLRTTGERRLFRQALRTMSGEISNSGEPSFRDWLGKALAQCQGILRWDLRTNPLLWHYDPLLALSSNLREVPPSETLEAAQALVASSRLRDSFWLLRALAFRSQGGKRAEAQELMGDILLVAESYELAGESYLAALTSRHFEPIRSQGIAVKAAVAFYRAKSSRIEAVFAVAGPMILSQRRSRVGDPKLPSIIVDPPGTVPLTRGLLRLLRGLTISDYEVGTSGALTLMAADPVVELGQVSSWQGQAGEALAQVIVEWRRNPRQAPPLPESFLDEITTLFTRERPLFPEDWSMIVPLRLRLPTVSRESRLFRQFLHVLLQEDAKITGAFFVRSREGVALGAWEETGDFLVDGDGQKHNFVRWKAAQVTQHAKARPGVYLEKLTGARYKAEQMFQAGMEKAYRGYALEEGAREIERSIAQDPLNVFALKVLAQIQGALGRFRVCAQVGERALALDPKAPGVTELVRFCRREGRHRSESIIPAPWRFGGKHKG